MKRQGFKYPDFVAAASSPEAATPQQTRGRFQERLNEAHRALTSISPSGWSTQAVSPAQPTRPQDYYFDIHVTPPHPSDQDGNNSRRPASAESSRSGRTRTAAASPHSFRSRNIRARMKAFEIASQAIKGDPLDAYFSPSKKRIETVSEHIRSRPKLHNLASSDKSIKSAPEFWYPEPLPSHNNTNTNNNDESSNSLQSLSSHRRTVKTATHVKNNALSDSSRTEMTSLLLDESDELDWGSLTLHSSSTQLISKSPLPRYPKHNKA